WFGLLAIVAIPLPGTGAWTGSILAALLGLNFWLSLLSIIVGVVIAGLIVAGTGLTVLLAI
ncbi:MAG: small multi-drug export protein, partial [Syntrophomonadaceae bacterium]|nr:small multi-drug export protein [Syntrophomonadaceae bacterium]